MTEQTSMEGDIKPGSPTMGTIPNPSFPKLSDNNCSSHIEKLLSDSAWKYEKDRVENLAKPRHSVTPITTKRN